MKAADVDHQASPSQSAKRWGSFKQRITSMQFRDNVDPGMWDKNDAAFLEEVARDSPNLDSSTGFDTLTPLEVSFAKASGAISMRHLSSSRSDNQLSARQTRTTSSTNTTMSSSSSSSANDDFMPARSKSSRKSRRPASGSGNTSSAPLVIRPTSNSSSVLGFAPTLSSPSDTSNRSSFNRYSSSPATSPTAPSFGFKPLDDKGIQVELEAETEAALSMRLQGTLLDPASVQDQTTSLPGSERLSAGSSSSAINSQIQLLDPIEDGGLLISSASNETNYPTQRSISANSLCPIAQSPQGWVDQGAPVSPKSQPLDPSLLHQHGGSPHPNVPVSPNASLLQSPGSERGVSTLSRKGSTKKTSIKSPGGGLVAGLKKLMGRRDKDKHDSGYGASPHFGNDEFRMPHSCGPKPVTEEVQIVGSIPLHIQVDHVHIIDANGGSATASNSQLSTPQAITSARFPTLSANDSTPSIVPSSPPNRARTQPSGIDALHSPTTLKYAMASNGHARVRTTSTESSGRSLRESITQRIRGSATHSRTSSRTSVIEHVSFDQARRASGLQGPIILGAGAAEFPERSTHEGMEELRTAGTDGAFEFDDRASSLRSPVRPPRLSDRPGSAQSVRGSDVYSPSSLDPSSPLSPTSVWQGFQPQIYVSGRRGSAVSTSSRASASKLDASPLSPSLSAFRSSSIDHGDKTLTGGRRSTRRPSTASVDTSYSQANNSYRRSMNSVGGSKSWATLLPSPLLSSNAASGASASHGHVCKNGRRLSTTSISRPLSVASSALSDNTDIGLDMAEAGSRQRMNSAVGRLVAQRNRLNSNGSEPAEAPSRASPFGQAASQRPSQIVFRRPFTASGSTAEYIASPCPPISTTSETSLHRALSTSNQRPNSADSPVASTKKRPSFGLAIEPEASSAFDCIPSPMLRPRRGSLADSQSHDPHPVSPRTQLFSEEEAEVEFLNDGGMNGRRLFREDYSFGKAPSDPVDCQIQGYPTDDQPPGPPIFMIHSVDEESGGGGGKLSRSTKDILFGSLAGMVSKVFEHPFDLVKVRLQTQSSDRPARYAGAFDCFKQVYLTEGFKGLFRGLSMPVMGATLENACLFFTYNRIQAIIRDINGSGTSKKLSSFEAEAEAPLSIPQLAIAAAGAGSITSLVLTPIELIKCKMQVQMIAGGGQSQAAAAASSPIVSAAASHLTTSKTHFSAGVAQPISARHLSSSSSAPSAVKVSNVKLDGPVALFRQTIRENGIRGLWLGQTGTLLRETGGGIAWFLAFESSSRWLIERKKAELKRSDITKKDLGSLQLIGAGALAGISYNVVLFPADCVKSTMQTEAELRGTMNGGGKATRTGFFQTFMNIYRTRGVRGLYAGCGVTCIRSAPSSALIFLMYNKLEQAADHYGL